MRLGRPVFSLGCSCQTRFAIDILSSDTRRNSFDFNISTKQGILDALRSEGRSFEHALSEATMYRTPSGAEGPTVNGIYFWHDFFKDESGAVIDGWEQHHPEVLQKYRYLWPRFMERIRSPEPKTFVVSNTQSNLHDFADDPDDFQRKFTLDTAFFNDLVSTFGALGVRNFEVLYLLQSIEGCVKLRAATDDPRLSVRFGGHLSNPGPSRWAYSFLLNETSAFRIEDLIGQYDNGIEVRRCGRDASVAYRDGQPIGELSTLPDGYLLMTPGIDDGITAYFESGTLAFSDETKWTQTRAAGRSARRTLLHRTLMQLPLRNLFGLVDPERAN